MTVLQRSQSAWLTSQKDKCVFLAASVEYLGHQIATQGVHPIAKKVEALQKVPQPPTCLQFWHLYTSYSRSQRHKKAQAFEKLLLDSQQLRQVFSRFGLSKFIVSDNGPQSVAEEFQQFCQVNGIRHIKVAPYHPSSNRLAERVVQVFKQGFYKSVRGTASDRISRFLFQYQLTPHSTTGVSPAELLMGRSLHSKLDLLIQQSHHIHVPSSSSTGGTNSFIHLSGLNF